MSEQAENSFEDVIERLEALVGQLEGGGLTLDRALKLYEEGIALTRRGSELLDGVEQRITELQKDSAGDET